VDHLKQARTSDGTHHPISLIARERERERRRDAQPLNLGGRYTRKSKNSIKLRYFVYLQHSVLSVLRSQCDNIKHGSFIHHRPGLIRYYLVAVKQTPWSGKFFEQVVVTDRKQKIPHIL